MPVTSRQPLMRLSRRLLAGTAAMLLLAACGAGAGGTAPVGTSAGESRPVRVVTTTTVFADIVQNVGGNRVSATSIIPPGVGPEDYEPKPDDARKLADADLVVSNGVGLDDFLDRLLSSTGGQAPRLVLGEKIPTLTVDGEENPHFWLDPSLVKQYYLPEIVARLTALDPAGKSTYEANSKAYAQQLDTLDAELKSKIEQIPTADRKLVTFHDAFPYFARHFGFELVGVVLENVGQEPSAAELAALVDKVKAAHVKAVFSEAQFSPRLSQTLATEAGVSQVVTTLYNDALGPAPADTYLGLMRWNVDQIVAALR
jgi:zinc/manganese transport system substrate-binding protein/manganese/iron transport system substrate-binding protein